MNGTVKGDGSADVRVWLSVDWTKFPKHETKLDGHVNFSSSDGTGMIVTLPAIRGAAPAANFKGAVQGDGYVVMEAYRGTSTAAKASDGVSRRWEQIPYYGRTHSGMTILPPTLEEWGSSGPSIEYDFWITHHSSADVEVALLFGPTLNYILGSRLGISVQMDDGEVQSIQPVPASKPGNLPDDWEEVVANEIRQVKVPVKLGNEVVGPHRLAIKGVLGGLVLERVIIDLGGIETRGKSYLGPPESLIIS